MSWRKERFLVSVSVEVDAVNADVARESVRAALLPVDFDSFCDERDAFFLTYEVSKKVERLTE